MNQTQSLLLTSNHGFGYATDDEDINLNKLTSPSRVVPDLPSWTAIRAALGNDGGSSDSDSDSEVDELAIKKNTNLAMEWHGRPPTNTQATVLNDTVTAKRVLKSPSAAKPPKGKKAQFDGVLISTKPPPYRKHSSQTRPKPAPASGARGLSLVDALARTFDANRHTEAPVSRPLHAVQSRRHVDASTAAQTDVETTEAEDEQLQLNTRLAHTPLKKQLARARAKLAVSANASETNSEDAASVLQDVSHPERPVKRLKTIQYESNSALIDVALGTVEAPISWDAEVDLIVRDEDFVTLAQTARAASADVRLAVDEGDRTAGSLENGWVAPASAIVPVGNDCCMPTHGNPKTAVLSPYLSRGAKFRQRLAATFGENATVRKDKVARPRPVDHDLYAPFDDLFDLAPNPNPNPNLSESTVSVSSASTAEEGASAIPSTHVTSQSPDTPPVDTDGSMNHVPRNHQLDDTGSVTKPTFDAGEEQINGWITALQRLVKGKVRITEEDLETLSIVLAEIESMQDSLNESVLMTSELRESVKQLSDLYEIPFGDRNKLRQRAENILHTWPSMGEPGSS